MKFCWRHFARNAAFIVSPVKKRLIETWEAGRSPYSGPSLEPKQRRAPHNRISQLTTHDVLSQTAGVYLSRNV
jgi:hypothetical protein